MNWLDQLSHMKKWQTKRMKELEDALVSQGRELEACMADLAEAHITIDHLNATVKHLKDDLYSPARDLVRGIEVEGGPRQTRHHTFVNEDQEWMKLIGAGYTDAQKRSQIYRHMDRLMTSARGICRDDATKMKQLFELVHERMHVNVERHVSQDETAAENLLCQAIADSIALFVSGLHEAGGAGRCPKAISHAQTMEDEWEVEARSASTAHTTAASNGS